MPSCSMAPRVIVTRPEREALQWVASLQARGIAAQALPLIAITPPADTGALQAARTRVELHLQRSRR